ncbi:hypothetical protein HRR83_000365 [Exophiala dermatitidis]|uniref:Uncharacterized protein n=1 Tax=Exophiala dermatitidis TaxID=5970 RepID=A0AAN6F3C0_EXODE|nr:hypothetical protein HRR75_000330 [Exophiala dermatitidis]KAJ4527613.1 hypothetical protein HRR74_000367 [Exophiala dermatitidis]KAJ4528249.1 hypothetical protein HRR73_000871 [Exophiala dermatitidis]KAJ4531189.1 hypothetical protein HRR76_008863 [Exophiala dermatitidis]KAJ4536196.1 hypothetical protein HRR78_008635 [Exophiala dermatitidis]
MPSPQTSNPPGSGAPVKPPPTRKRKSSSTPKSTANEQTKKLKQEFTEIQNRLNGLTDLNEEKKKLERANNRLQKELTLLKDVGDQLAGAMAIFVEDAGIALRESKPSSAKDFLEQWRNFFRRCLEDAAPPKKTSTAG